MKLILLFITFVKTFLLYMSRKQVITSLFPVGVANSSRLNYCHSSSSKNRIGRNVWFQRLALKTHLNFLEVNK